MNCRSLFQDNTATFQQHFRFQCVKATVLHLQKWGTKALKGKKNLNQAEYKNPVRL